MKVVVFHIGRERYALLPTRSRRHRMGNRRSSRDRHPFRTPAPGRARSALSLYRPWSWWRWR